MTLLPWPCGICRGPIEDDSDWTAFHGQLGAHDCYHRACLTKVSPALPPVPFLGPDRDRWTQDLASAVAADSFASLRYMRSNGWTPDEAVKTLLDTFDLPSVLTDTVRLSASVWLDAEVRP